MSGQPRARANRWRLAGGAAAVLFAVLVLRFWHPVYGFTRFLQLDAENDSTKIQAFRDQPIYVFRNTGGYDGQYYAQIAYHPLLGAPELRTAVDNLNYRARRILPAAMAWVLAAGRPTEIARIYAWLNVACWFVLAALAWRVLGVADAKSFVAWAGILFSAGTLLSVRFALTDLIAATLTLAAVGAAGLPSLFQNPTVHAGVGGARPFPPSKNLIVSDGENEARLPSLSNNLPVHAGVGGARSPSALGPTAFGSRNRTMPSALGDRAPPTLALAALGRETALLALPGLWTRPWLSRKNLIATLVAALPLAVWLAYIRWRLGPGDAGFSNFTWPLLGLANKWIASVRALSGPIDFPLTLSTLLAVAGLTVQGIYCAVRPRLDDPWWRVAIANVVLLAFLGQAVWEGFPGAAFRAVLPLTLACNLLMARRQANWFWLIGGNLTVAAGLIALWQVPIDPRELGAAAAGGQRAIVWEGSGWYGAEHSARHRWAWAGGPASIAVDYWPGGPAKSRREAEVRSPAPQSPAQQVLPQQIGSLSPQAPQPPARQVSPEQIGSLAPQPSPEQIRSLAPQPPQQRSLALEQVSPQRITLHCEADLRSLAPQQVTVRQGARICWQGVVGPAKTPAAWDITVEGSHAELELDGDHAPVPESAAAQARALAFAVYDLKVSFSDAPPGTH